MGKKILLINCAYRLHSVTDQMVNEIYKQIETSGHKITTLHLREQTFSNCINCRVCAQNNGEIPGECVNKDIMNDIVGLIEQSDGYVIATPAKLYTTAKYFKNFLERLAVYSYWPYGKKHPTPIKQVLSKKAILISAFPVPEVLARIYSKTINQLKICARLIGAKTVDTLYIGMAPISSKRKLTFNEKAQAKEAVEKLLSIL